MTILTIPEVARILHVTPKVVREQCAKGCLPARKIGGSWRIEESLLAQWFQNPEAACPFISRKFPDFSLVFSDSRHNYGTASSHHPEERLVLHHVPLRRPALE